MSKPRAGRAKATEPKHVVILCHPEPASFNMAVARTYCETVEACGHRAVLRDLYRMAFDPVLKVSERPNAPNFAISPDVAAELEILADAAVLVLVYPIWFGTPPAMLKGYVERVLGAGVTYRAVESGEGHPVIAGKKMVSFTSSGTSRPWLEEQGAWLSLRDIFDHYLKRAFSLASDDHLHLGSIGDGISERFMQENLAEVRERARLVCSEVPRSYG